VADGRAPHGGSGNRLSPQTLVVASLASLTAAIVTSHFWRGGTPITAALTPVIVALASELYRRPAERITRLGSRAAAVTARQRERVPSGLEPPPPPLAPPTEWEDPSGPIRIYRQVPSRRRIHPKVIIATAVVAFAIAAAVLTLPELVFGGSVASHGRTTFFGGGSKHHSSTSTQTTTTVTTQSSSSSSSATPTTTVTVPAPAQQQQTTTQTSSPLGATGPTGP
jgi:hypothetical protein